jgi:hypothetical protein
VVKPHQKKLESVYAMALITKQEYVEKLLKDNEAAKNKKSKILKNPRKKPNLAKKGKSKPTAESSDSEESSIAIQPSSDEDDEEASYLGAGDGDFVIVSYGLKKYPGHIIEQEDNLVKVKCMEQVGKFGNWKWPKKEDVLWYTQNDILKIIPPPITVNNRGYYSVKDMEKYVDQLRSHHLMIEYIFSVYFLPNSNPHNYTVATVILLLLWYKIRYTS